MVNLRWFHTLLVVLWLLCGGSYTLRCDRTPEGNTAPRLPADGRFRLRILGNPDKYSPGEIYTVSLQGSHSLHVPHKFSGFLLTAEQEAIGEGAIQYSGGQLGGQDGPLPGAAGSFALYGDALTKFSDRCPNAVTQTSSMPKSEIQVMWTAPTVNSGCVTFRATVVEVRDVWYMDDGPLSRTLCEDSQDSLDLQPSVVDPCEACDEAKYEVTFEGLWSRHTHPKDFPSNGWLTRFSDVIGASHTVDYRFWEYGKPASEGLRQVAEHGATRMLESELKAESEHIRTIIKARGISYPNVTGKTFAVFRVDRRHHLVSLVSMLFPSPDWILGVSGLELCSRNGSWIESRVLNLYPWDAGTDSGPSYISPDQPTNPRDVIRRIRPNYPNDPRSPFYDPAGGEMKPFARLHLARQRLYEKACENGPDNMAGDEQDDQSGACAVGNWMPWQPCSASCGQGVRRRQRYYLDENKAEIMSCKRQLTDRGTCWMQDCSKEAGGSNQVQQSMEARGDDDEFSSGECALSPWSEWSACSAKCGKGTRMRHRRYRRRGAMKHCRAGKARPPPLQQNDECIGEGEDCGTENSQENGSLDVPAGCPMTMWSTWSPCSATCGKGMQMRSRYPVAPNEQLRNMYKRGLARQYQARINSADEDHYTDRVDENGIQNDENEDEDEDNEDDDEEISIAACENVLKVQQVECEAPLASCDMLPPHMKEPCTLPLDPGPCRAPGLERWYFNSERQSCEPFMYSGCYGNNNNFKNKEQCEEACPKGPDDNLFGDLSSDSQKIDNRDLYGIVKGPQLTGDGTLTGYDKTPLYLQSTQHRHNTPNVVNCQVTEWSAWGECSVTCGRGFKQKNRHIKKHPVNGGKQCPSKLLKRRTCRRAPCRHGNGGGEGEGNDRNESHDLQPTWGPANAPDKSRIIDCLLSDWSAWSPCSATCGATSMQRRTRIVLQEGRRCDHRVETRSCGLFPCPLY